MLRNTLSGFLGCASKILILCRMPSRKNSKRTRSNNRRKLRGGQAGRTPTELLESVAKNFENTILMSKEDIKNEITTNDTRFTNAGPTIIGEATKLYNSINSTLSPAASIIIYSLPVKLAKMPPGSTPPTLPPEEVIKQFKAAIKMSPSDLRREQVAGPSAPGTLKGEEKNRFTALHGMARIIVPVQPPTGRPPVPSVLNSPLNLALQRTLMNVLFVGSSSTTSSSTTSSSTTSSSTTTLKLGGTRRARSRR